MANHQILEKAQLALTNGNLIQAKIWLTKVNNPTGLDRMVFARLQFQLSL